MKTEVSSKAYISRYQCVINTVTSWMRIGWFSVLDRMGRPAAGLKDERPRSPGVLRMEKYLTVVLGAGASKDCVAEGEIDQFNNDWRPPLTSELFAARANFNTIM